MFKENDYVNYGQKGICKIDEISEFDFGPDRKKRLYYVLKPVFDKNSKIYVPVKNEELTNCMRKILTEDEINSIILSIKNEKICWIKDHKQRTEKFNRILKQRDERQLLQMIRCICMKTEGKKLSGTDMQMLKKAEQILDQEFSFSLKIGTDDVRGYIINKLK